MMDQSKEYCSLLRVGDGGFGKRGSIRGIV